MFRQAVDEVRPDETTVEFVMRILEQYITEERTDEWINLIDKVNLPRWVPKFIIKRVLDKLFPEQLLLLLRGLLLKVS